MPATPVLPASASAAASTEALEARRRARLPFLLVPFGLHLAGNFLGTAFSPSLLVHHPEVLVAVSPLWRHLVLASPAVEALPFFTLAALGLLFSDPFQYLLGRDHGPEALAWLERRAGGAGRALRLLERAFDKAGWLLLLFSPGPFVCALAGARRMNVPLFVALNLAGTFGALLIVRRFGEAAAEPLLAVRAYVEQHLVAFTVGALLLALLYGWSQQRSAHRKERERGVDLDV